MSIDASKIATPINLMQVNGTAGPFGTQTGTRQFDVLSLPPGRKAVQISMVTSATVTMNVQASLDKTNWFNVVISTNTSVLSEVDSVAPFWRLNITSHTTSGTGSNAPMVAFITQGPV